MGKLFYAVWCKFFISQESDCMHIVHIIPTLSFGGAERTVVDIINNASEEFHFSVIVFSNDTPLKDQIIRKDVSVICIPKKGQISWHLFGDIAAELKKLQPDVVHTHLFGGDLWGRLAARRLKIPVVTTEHNMNNDEGFLKAFLKRIFKKRTQQYSACSEGVKKYMSRRYGIKKNVEVIYPGVDIGRFSAPVSNFAFPLKIVMVGRFVEQKGQKIGLQALSSIDKSLWRLSLVGAGPLKYSLQQWCKTLNIEENVTFVPPTSRIEQVYARHDILLMPSLWEGLGIVPLEAMAAGRVVIASDVPGLSEIVKNNETGILVPPSASAFTEVIRTVCEDRGTLSHIANNAREYASKNFAVEKMIRSYEFLYKKVVLK